MLELVGMTVSPVGLGGSAELELSWGEEDRIVEGSATVEGSSPDEVGGPASPDDLAVGGGGIRIPLGVDPRSRF